jgi:aminoglycoside phosphotransferase (APT) family kinase protein
MALDRLDALPDGDRLCHGDYHPANLLLGSTGPVLVDWTNASRGDPMADLARTRVLLRVAAGPTGGGAWIGAVERFGRGLLWRRLLTAYRRVRPVDAALLARWELVRVAERLRDGLEDEYPALLAILRQAEG